jgi:hypothetical protein
VNAAVRRFTGPGVAPEVTPRDGEAGSYSVASAFVGVVTLEQPHGPCSWAPLVSVTVPATGTVVARSKGNEFARFRLRALAFVGGVIEPALGGARVNRHGARCTGGRPR